MSRKLTKKSIFDVEAVAEHMKPVHRYKMWKHLISRTTAQHEADEGKSLNEIVPFKSISAPVMDVEAITENFHNFTTKVIQRQDSAKGDTTKLLIQLQDGHLIETVIMQHHKYRTVCLSSQIGCKMGCKFCATGTMGIIGNLTSGEIIEQVVHANAISKIRNIVFMGMGEPLNNMTALCTALDFLIDTRLFSLSPRHVTVSTVGVVKNMRKLTDNYPTVNLALSLHAPNQEVRLKIVPSASAHKYETLIAELYHRINRWNKDEDPQQVKGIPASFGDGNDDDAADADADADDKSHTSNVSMGSKSLKANFKKHVNGAGIMIEYIMIKNINVLPEHAEELGAVLSGMREEILLNLIPYNPTDIAEDFEPPTMSEIDEFVSILTSEKYRIHTRVRHEKGQDIDGACGQLVVQTINKKKTKNVDIEDMATGGRKKTNRKTEISKIIGTKEKKRNENKFGFDNNLLNIAAAASIGLIVFSAYRARR